VSAWNGVMALACAGTTVLGPAHPPVWADSATTWIREALDAMGGEVALRSLHGLHMAGVDETAGAAFSPHRTEPRMTHELFDTWLDLDHHRLTRRVTAYAPNFRDGLSYRAIVAADDRVGIQETDRFGAFPIDSASLDDYADQLSLAPERLLLTALASPDLHALPDTLIGGRRYHTLAFAHNRTKVLVSATTHLPLAVETIRAVEDPDWIVWGDLVTRTTFSSWSLTHGVHLPRTRTTARNGLPYELVSLSKLDAVDPVASDSFAIPDNLRQMARTTPPVALGNGNPTSIREIADGVVFIPGIWNVILVRQSDGLVVIEAPHSPTYSRLVVAEAARRFPNVPIKALVTTDFMWSHYAGVREYVARGVPVYAAASNVDDLRHVIASPHRIAPDSLARASRVGHLTPVTSRTTIGSGPNRVELISAVSPGTDYGERMIVVYLPDRHLLYASDLLPTPAFEPNFVTQGTADVVGLVAREHLSVDSVLAIHIAPTAWAPVVASVQSDHQ